jgi:hypothetical protein
MRTCFFFVSSEAMHAVAEGRAGSTPIGKRTSIHLQLHQRVPGGDSFFVLCLQGIELVHPHQLDIANWTVVVKQKKEIFEQLEIFLEFLP